MAGSSVATKWRQIQGKGNWEGMLDPLDEDLCKELLRYSHLAVVVTENLDTRNGESGNKWYGFPLYKKSTMFEKVKFKNPGYTVHKYLYWSSFALPLDPPTTFCGYIAVSDDTESARLGRRDIVIAFRGTQFKSEWAIDIASIISIPDPEVAYRTLSESSNEQLDKLEPLAAQQPSKVLIGLGWLQLYTSTSDQDKSGFGRTPLRLQMVSALKELLSRFNEEEISITVTGHSLGAAMSGLCAYDIVNERINVTPGGKPVSVTAFSFASPKVGNSDFKKAAESMENLKILRVTNAADLIPKFPFVGYSDTGVELRVNTASSPYLKQGKDAPNHHSLGVYCHLISGKVVGSDFTKYYQLELVNTRSGMLLDKFNVPPAWYVDINVEFEVDDTGKYTVTVKNIVPGNPDY